MANCPDESDMACFIDRLLPDDEVRQIEMHLPGCVRCGEIVEITKKVVAWIEGSGV